MDINGLKDLDYIRLDVPTLTMGAIARDSAVERAPWIGERKWTLLHDVSRVVADPVVRQMGTVVGSLCHNDPSGDWTAVALAARAELVIRGASGERTVGIDEFLVDSFTTAVQEGEMALAVRFCYPRTFLADPCRGFHSAHVVHVAARYDTYYSARLPRTNH